MQWTDEGIVLGAKRHGEANAILDLMTRDARPPSRHGARRRRLAAEADPAARQRRERDLARAARRASRELHASSRCNLRASDFFSAPHAIYGVGHLAALMRLLPERDPHWLALRGVRHLARPPCRCARGPRRWSCASNCNCLPSSASASISPNAPRPARLGSLIYVSPKSGRAVSREAGTPYADRMLRLPAFLGDAGDEPAAEALADGFALTGFFLERYVLEPRGLGLTEERARFIAAILAAKAVAATSNR